MKQFIEAEETYLTHDSQNSRDQDYDSIIKHIKQQATSCILTTQ